MRSDRELLLGLLALQCGFISKEQLVAAFTIWTLNKSRSIEQILRDNNAIQTEHESLLRGLVEAHLRQHDNDPEKSLASIGSIPSIKSDLEKLADSELHATLMHVASKGASSDAPAHDPFVTVSTQNFKRETSRFRILRPHAAGGLGQVSVAMDEELKREVAFKEIKSEYADHEESRQRFVREAEITGALEHPSIVPVYGLGTYGDGRPYYAMRFIKGDSLKDWISQFHKKKGEMSAGERTLALRQLLSRFIDVCQAMHYAHSRGVLHRDLKPHNVMLGKYGETLVVDWGLAKSLGEKTKEYSPDSTALVTPNLSGSHDVSVQGSAMGTPIYMSPEQAEGKLDELGPATDIYSLGVTLYHCLAGRVPFEQKSKAEVIEAVRKGEYLKPREIDSSIPKPLESICLKAMQLKPSDRYATAQAIADDLEHYLADEPITAHRETATERVTRFSRKHKSATLTAVICLSAIVALLSGGIWIVTVQREAARKLALRNQLLATEKTNLAQDKTKLADEQEKLAKNLSDQLTRNYAQEKLLRRETAMLVFDRGLSAYDSGFVKEGKHNLLRAIALAHDDPERLDGFQAVTLDYLSSAGAFSAPPFYSGNWADRIAFSPDGCRFAYAVFGANTVQILDTDTGQQVGQVVGIEALVNHIAFSLDGSRIATATRNNRPSGQIKREVNGSFTQSVDHEFSVTQIWNLESGTQVGTSVNHEGLVEWISFSPNGEWIATASRDKTVRIWDVASGTQIGKEMQHDRAVGCVVFSPNGSRIATTHSGLNVFNSLPADKIARIWDTTSGKQVTESQPHEDLLTSVAFSPDGRHFATASKDGATRVWDTELGTLVCKIAEHGRAVNCVAFSPDGQRIATASDDKTARFWDAVTGIQIGRTIKLESGVSRIAFSADGCRVTIAAEDGTVRVGNASTSIPMAIGLNHNRYVNYVAFSPDGSRIATASGDGTATLWDSRTEIQDGKSMSHGDIVLAVAFSLDGSRMATVANDDTAKIWNVFTRTQIGETLKNTAGLARGIALSPNGNRLATTTWNGTTIWDVGSDNQITNRFHLTKRGGSFDCVAFSKDSQLIAAGTGSTVHIWDVETGSQIGKGLVHEGSVACVDFDQNRQRIVTASEDMTARIWDLNTGNQIGKSMKHMNRVNFAAFFPDGHRIITASEDKTARIWDAETGIQLGESLRHDACVHSVGFNPDGRHVFTASMGKSTRTWDISTIPLPQHTTAWLELLSGYESTVSADPIPLTGEKKASRLSQLHEDLKWTEAIKKYRSERHEYAATARFKEAESDHHHFAAAFYLKQLLKTHPEDADLKSRLANAEKFLPHWRLDFDAHKTEVSADWKTAVPLLEELANHYPADMTIAERLKKAKEGLVRSEGQKAEESPPKGDAEPVPK